MRVTVRDRAGHLLVTRSASTTLPVVVPGAQGVVETYRLNLGQAAGRRVETAGRVQVDVNAQTRSDANVPAPGGLTVSTNTETTTTTPKNLAKPPEYQYFHISFTTCDLKQLRRYESCPAQLAGTPPFQGVGLLRHNGGDVDDRYGFVFDLEKTRGRDTLFIYAERRSAQVLAEVVWGGYMRTGTGVGTPGLPGTHAAFDLTRNADGTYRADMWGYLECRTGDVCKIPQTD